jgi:hypothetical protein
VSWCWVDVSIRSRATMRFAPFLENYRLLPLISLPLPPPLPLPSSLPLSPSPSPSPSLTHFILQSPPFLSPSFHPSISAPKSPLKRAHTRPVVTSAAWCTHKEKNKHQLTPQSRHVLVTAALRLQTASQRSSSSSGKSIVCAAHVRISNKNFHGQKLLCNVTPARECFGILPKP